MKRNPYDIVDIWLTALIATVVAFGVVLTLLWLGRHTVTTCHTPED